MGTAATSARAGAKAKLSGAPKVAKVTVGELRTNFKAVEAKLAKGVRVQVTRRGEVVAEVVPPVAERNDFARHVPEMMARMREIWGDKPLDIDTTAWVSEGRDRDFLF